MIDLFSNSNPKTASPGKLQKRQMLDQGARQIEQQFDDQPEVRAQVASTMGSVYEALGRYESAVRLLNEALVLQRQVSGDVSIEVAHALLKLSRLHFYKGQYRRAAPLVIRQQWLGLDHPRVASAHLNLGLLLRQRGEHSLANDHFAQARRIFNASFGESHWQGVVETHHLAALDQ